MGFFPTYLHSKGVHNTKLPNYPQVRTSGHISVKNPFLRCCPWPQCSHLHPPWGQIPHQPLGPALNLPAMHECRPNLWEGSRVSKQLLGCHSHSCKLVPLPGQASLGISGRSRAVGSMVRLHEGVHVAERSLQASGVKSCRAASVCVCSVSTGLSSRWASCGCLQCASPPGVNQAGFVPRGCLRSRQPLAKRGQGLRERQRLAEGAAAHPAPCFCHTVSLPAANLLRALGFANSRGHQQGPAPATCLASTTTFTVLGGRECPRRVASLQGMLHLLPW